MKFTATTRSVQGSSASRRLRRAGRVPAILYGAGEPAVSIELDHNEIFHLLRKEQFYASVLEMNLDGKEQRALLRSVQWHPYKPLVLHVDFQRVKAGQAITTRVPLHFIGGDESPAVKLQNAVISTITSEVEITCLPRHLPSSIEVDLSKLEAGSTINLSAVVAPEGVEFNLHGEDDVVLAVATVPEAADLGEEEGEASADSVDNSATKNEA